MLSSRLLSIFITLLLTACTTGQLYTVDEQGNRNLVCDVEFVGMPSVDVYAVEYALSLCAKSAVRKGYSVEETELLSLDTTIPAAPCGSLWDHELAKQKYKQGELSKKQYGYIVANIDLGLAVLNECAAKT
jgi:hypothetical protein